MLAIVVEVSIMCAFAEVVARAALILWICTALIVQMLTVRPVHMAGLLGGPFVRSLAVVAAPAVCLVLAVVGPPARLTAVIGVVTVAPPAVLAPSAVC